MTVTEAALDVLADSTIDVTRVYLPPGQLDRKVYAEVDKVLSRLGGSWNRKAKAHLFESDPTAALAFVLDTGQMPADADKIASFFRTPPAIVDLLINAVRLGEFPGGSRVLEPSAGDGAIADVIAARFPGLHLAAVEPDEGRVDKLYAAGHVPYRRTFQDFVAGSPLDTFAAIVMNPPFTEPGKPMAWAEHVSLALTLLASGGRLAAIVPSSIEHSTRPQAVQLRADIKRLGGSWSMLPERAFRESGTDVKTALVTVTA